MIDFRNINIDISPLEEKYDLFFAALGYETRCVYIASEMDKLYSRAICFEFPNKQNDTFNRNKNIFEAMNFIIEPFHDDTRLMESIKNHIESFETNDPEAIKRIAIDISSMSRLMVASIIYSIFNLLSEDIEIALLYAPAKYSKPPIFFNNFMDAAPVIPEYTGWPTDLQNPVTAIIGLGYEYGRALGVFDYMDASDAFLFVPYGEDKRYETDIFEVNDILINEVGDNKIISYKLDDPYELFIELRSLTEGLKNKSRLVILPFGPKLFNAIALLIAEEFKPNIAVWRVNSDNDRGIFDQESNDKIVSFKFRIHAE